MKLTLLEIVQDILNEMDSDDVNSIEDTIESQQVANIVRSCYNELISNRNWPHLKDIVQLEASGNVSRPTHMRLPERLRELSNVKYDVRKVGIDKRSYTDVKYKDPEAFMSMLSLRDSTKSNVTTVVDPSSVELLIINDKAPQFFTSFDDDWIVFDSYDSAVDTTLKKSKTQAVAFIDPQWVHEDGAYPDLPPDAFALLTEEAKSVAFLTLKQMGNEKAEQRSARQNRWLSRKAWRVDGTLKTPNYGRK